MSSVSGIVAMDASEESVFPKVEERSASSSVESMEVENTEQEVWSIRVRSPKLPGGQVSVPTMPSSDLITLVEFVNEVLGESSTIIDPRFARLIIKGKSPDLQSRVDEVLRNGDTVMLVFSSAKEVEAMQRAEKVDMRIRSFEQEEELHRKRLEVSSAAYNSFWGEDQDSRYRFVKIETCPRFTTPHPFEAEKLLIKLATDPGVKKIMRKYQWTVGTLAEMDPKNDMISLRKEQDGACVLGYNENAGHKIYLRLRTDDELEFRGYDGLINTLLHELTHNVRGPHDEEFWRVFGQLKTEYLQFHETEYRQGSSKARRVINTKAKVEREIRGQAGNQALSESERRAAQSTVAKPKEDAAKPYIPMRLGATQSQARRQERERLAKAAEARFKALEGNEVSSTVPEVCGENHSPSEHSNQSHQPEVPQKAENPLNPQEDTIVEMRSTSSPVVAHPMDVVVATEVLKENAPAVVETEPVRQFNEPSPIGLDEANTSDRERRVRASIIQLCRSKNTTGAALVHLIVKNALTGEAKFKQVKTSGEKFKRSIDPSSFALLEAAGFDKRENDLLVLTRHDPGLLTLVRLLLEDSGLVL